MLWLLGEEEELRDAVIVQVVHLLKEDLHGHILTGTTMLNIN